MVENELKLKEGVEYLGIPEKNFRNYLFTSEEIKHFKKSGKWFVKKSDLDAWKKLKEERTIILNLKEYEKCFEFAIEVVYGGSALFGIRGQRSEMQAVDNWILGILAEYALKRFLKEKFNFDIVLDEEVHPGTITPKDIVGIIEKGKKREPKIFVGVKGSKLKNCFLIADEFPLPGRGAEIYVFARVDLPSDHLFRILREHSFFKNAKDFLESHDNFRKIGELKEVPVWICGYVESKNLEKTKEIPGQEFEDYRYVKSVANMKNSDNDWKIFVRML
jgi:hypothetical protein